MTSGRQRDRTALAISIALHVCAWTLLALALRSIFPPPPPGDVYIVRIPQVDRLPAAKAAPLQHEPSLPPPQPPPPALHIAIAHLHRRPIVAGEQRYAQPVRRAAPDAAALTLAGAPAAGDDAPAPAPSSTPSPVAVAVAPSPRGDPATTAGGNSEGIGNFGESDAAALAPEARAALVAGIASGFVVRVKVDENGHATDVAFLRGPDDPAMRELIRERLFAAHFIHAVSNGLPVEGAVELLI